MTRTGWFQIGEVFQLYMDQYDPDLGDTKRELIPVRVEHVHITESNDETPTDYTVKHYDRDGHMVKQLRVDGPAVDKVISDREPTGKPGHIKE